MKKLLIITLCLVSLSGPMAYAVEKKWSELTAITDLNDADYTSYVQGGMNYKITWASILADIKTYTDTLYQATSDAKESGVAGDLGLYEANSTDTDAAGFRGPTAIDANKSYRGQLNAAGPSSANMVQAWAASGSGDGTPASPYIHALSWIDMDSYAVIAAPVFTTSIEAPFLILGSAATAADAGAIRLPNAAYIYSEADAAGTDISVIGVDSSEVVQIAASGASAVTITPNTTITGDLTVTGADATLGTGLKITGGAGVATFTDLAGTSETFAIDLRTENTAKFTTSSGVTDINVGAMNLVTTGAIQHGIKINSDANGMSESEMTAVGLYGTMFIATGSGTWALPTAAVGMSACLVDTGTNHDLILDVQAGDDIQLKGTEQANGVGITNAATTTTGDFVCVVAISAGHWMTLGMGGVWASQ